jgi:hypothetical protein
LFFDLVIRRIVCNPVVVTGVSLLRIAAALEASFVHFGETLALVLAIVIAIPQGRCGKHTNAENCIK